MTIKAGTPQLTENCFYFLPAVWSSTLRVCVNWEWDKMYLAARNVQKKREISPLVEAGGVSAAILTEKGNIYVGVCIDTACSLGMCAERNAIANMITNGENGICRLIAVDRNGKAIPPCGACREFMVQLMPDHYHSIQIMMDYENKKMVTLGDITPNWWI